MADVKKNPVFEAILTVVRTGFFSAVSSLLTFGLGAALQIVGVDTLVDPQTYAIIVVAGTVVLQAIDKFAHEYNKLVPESKQIGFEKGISPV